MNEMKKIFFVLGALALLVGCYPDYVMDYDDGAAVYTAYQYDLRTFVLGEKQSFDFTVALGGVIDNTMDRTVTVELNPSLLTQDLSELVPDGGYNSFTAMDGLLGKGKFGSLSQAYVTQELNSANISSLVELPAAYYNVSGLDAMTIQKGRHTANVTIQANDVITEDANAFAPYYALGFQITSSPSTPIVSESSFEVIVVKCENRLFGYWSHGGETVTYDETGTEVDRTTYEMSNEDSRVYTLTTVDANTVMTNKIGKASGKLYLNIGSDNSVTVSSADGKFDISPIDGKPSTFNGEQLIQNRRICLNYKYTRDSYTYVVNDVLEFRSRTRDGVLEYQDERTELY